MKKFLMFLSIFYSSLETFVCRYNREKHRLNDYILHYEPLRFDQESFLARHSRVRRSLDANEELDLNFHAHGRYFPLRLRRDNSIFSATFVPEGDEFHPGNIYHGFIENDKGSHVQGFIHNKIFEGKVHTSKGDEFHIEPSSIYFKDPDFHSVIYNVKDIHYPHPYGGGCGVKESTKKWMHDVQTSAKGPEEPVKFQSFDGKDKWREEAQHNKHSRQRRAFSKTENSCQLFVQADWLFTDNFAGSVDRALYVMTQHVRSVSHIYENTDFDGDNVPEGINFVIARMRANTSKCTGEKCQNPFMKPNIGVESFLELNSEMNHDHFCLAYIFTYRDFQDGVLGLAWIAEPSGAAGGVCEKFQQFSNGKKKSLNTGIVTTLNYGRKVPSKVTDITLAHEIGHNFGSKHDPTTGSSCAPGAAGGGNYIMYPRATSGSDTNNYKFSKCSKDYIWPVLQSKAVPPCFKKPTGPICGNKIVEEEEQCDCGYIGECNDKCCVARDATAGKGCKYVTNSTQCSPSEGPCCDKNTCKVVGVNANETCGQATECAGIAKCNGVNATCPKAPPKPDITTVCSEGAKVCLDGGCTGSICLKHNQTECMCANKDHLCDICCKANNDSTTCKTLDLKQAPGTPCDNYNGYCDIFYKCRKVDAEGPLSRLKKFIFNKQTFENILTWMKAYWWACVLIGLGLILFMAGFIKLCSVHTPSSNPQMPKHRQMTLPRTLSRRRRAPGNGQNRSGAGRGPGARASAPPVVPNEEPLPGYETAIRQPPPRYNNERVPPRQNLEMGAYRY